eukprot:1909212-Amphidinium_carterae.1
MVQACSHAMPFSARFASPGHNVANIFSMIVLLERNLPEQLPYRLCGMKEYGLHRRPTNHLQPILASSCSQKCAKGKERADEYGKRLPQELQCEEDKATLDLNLANMRTHLWQERLISQTR